ncbi:MAG: glycosyl transferase [Candidatus Moranbacteria bacterium CG06_land_8_20_14_3_00_43_56]|nr:MAG: glycosyl transferase [Candidatus Moranbacteria bacterium CG06_land_8_20_14_3_00_43_56]PIW93633.1 MAG: glycosyl transferase [Candidatus Moranbacteria bacterium CG_4_8_14_3_um_filter_43_15]PJA85604.1 MAG: glycosyl transferase [Candidatus Moranbacteria bacterium CG_4_9_14_3_um_filter_44_28]
MKSGRISVVVPCFNEEKTIYFNLKNIFDYLNNRFHDFELIAVNDGSADKTLEELRRFQKEFPIRIIDNQPNEGKGKAVQRGILKSRFETVMFLDADLGIPIEELDGFLEEVKNGFDLVIASRFVPGLKILRPVVWHRRIMEKIFRLLRIIIINIWNIKDTQCGFKVFRREAAMKIFSRLTVKRFAFDAEVIFLANKFGYKMKELPISLQNPPESHIRLVRDPLNMTWDLLRIRVNDWRGKYK